MSDLAGNGERFVPTLPVAELALEHWHRYLLASQFAAERHVLDVACGVGYGSDLLARTAKRVLGIDRDQQAINWARINYNRPNLEFRCADAVEFRSGEAEFGVIVSFETIEHLPSPATFLERLKIALRPGGILLISSPDKQAYGRTRRQPNPHHCSEMERDEFAHLLGRHFRQVKLIGQRVVLGSALWPLDPGQATGVPAFAALSEMGCDPANRDPEPTYWIAICSDAALPSVELSILERAQRLNPIASLLGGIRERDEAIARLTKQRDDLLKNSSSGGT